MRLERNREDSSNESVALVFNYCQKSVANHRKGIAALERIYEQNPDVFLGDVIAGVKRILLVGKREKPVERLIQFLILFSTTTKIMLSSGNRQHKFYRFMLGLLIQLTEAKSEPVRFRSTQLVAGILEHLPEETDISARFWDEMVEKMVTRTEDRAARVRHQSVLALARMQDPRSKTCPVIKAYLNLLNNESPKVREAVVEKIGISKVTLNAIVEKARDVSVDVRGKTFEVINSRVDVKSLPIKTRAQLLTNGLQDREPAVREKCRIMLNNWYKSLDQNPIKLIKAVYLCDEPGETTNIATTVLALKECITNSVGAAEACSSSKAKNYLKAHVDIANLSIETALFWRIFCEHFSNHSDILEELLPTPVEFCRILNDIKNSEMDVLEQLPIIEQLLQLGWLLDLTDEAGREALGMLLCEMLISPETNAELIGKIMALLAKSNEDSQFVDTTVKVLKLIKIPLENYSGEMLKQLEEFVYLRSLNIIYELLEKSSKIEIEGSFLTMAQEFIDVGLAHESKIRSAAIQVQGVLCLLSKSCLDATLPTYPNLLNSEDCVVQGAIMKSLFDIMMVYGVDNVKEAMGDFDILSFMKEFILILARDLDEDRIKVRGIVVEGMCKLLFNDYIKNQEDILPHLIMAYFDPSTEDDQCLRQCLHVFFNGYVFEGKPTHIAALKQAFVPTLKNFTKKTRSTKLSDSLANFLLEITNTAQSKYQQIKVAKKDASVQKDDKELCLHFCVLQNILNELLEGNTTAMLEKLCCKIITRLSLLQPYSVKELEEAQKSCISLVDQIADAVSRKNLQKMEEVLENIKAEILDNENHDPAKNQEDQDLDAQNNDDEEADE